MSAKAAGKQPQREEPATVGASKPRLDTQSEEAFPALGAPKSQPAAAPSMWSKKPAAVGKAAQGTSNGTANGYTNGSKAASRTSTPMSGMVAPSSTAPSQGGKMQLPGRQSEQISLPISMMTPRNQLKKPLLEILRDINKRSKATIEVKAGPSGHMTFEDCWQAGGYYSGHLEEDGCAHQHFEARSGGNPRGR